MSKEGNVMGNYKELSYTESKKQILEFAKESRKRKWSCFNASKINH